MVASAQPGDVPSQIAALRRDLNELSRRIVNAATVASGSILVVDGSGNVVASLSTASRSLSDGAAITMVANDASGVGLARPWIPVAFTAARTVDLRVSTAAAAETVWTANPAKTHPKIQLTVYDGADAGTSGTIFVVIGGVTVDSWSTSGTPSGHARGPYALPAGNAYATTIQIQVQARRDSGSGSIYLGVGDAYQRQS